MSASIASASITPHVSRSSRSDTLVCLATRCNRSGKALSEANLWLEAEQLPGAGDIGHAIAHIAWARGPVLRLDGYIEQISCQAQERVD